MGPRETALNALVRCRREGGWSNGALKEGLARDRLDRRDAALAVRLCYGVLQNREKLDFYLAQFYRGKIKKLHPILRDILHMGLYQIDEMDRIPDSAAVNESVLLAKKYCRSQQNAPALVNGVLRSAVRAKGHWTPPDSLPVKYSHPAKLVQRLEEAVGREWVEAVLAANNQAPKTVIQVNSLRTTQAALLQALAQEQVQAEPHSWLPDCLTIANTGDLEALPSFQKGWFYVQDPAARLSVLCAGIPEGAKVLDCCAAPGGKSFAAAILLGGKGSVFSADIHPHKLTLLQKGAARLGLENVSVCLQDASEERPEWKDQMDVVLADVPCSGYGVIRKKPEIRYRDPDTVRELPALQLAILNRQAAYVKPGGILLYSTCTLLREENEGVAEAFLARHPGFAPEPLPLPGSFPGHPGEMLTLLPGEYDTDGFFICRFRRNL